MLNVLRQSFKQGRVLKLVLIAVGLGLVAFLGNYFVGNGGSGGSTGWVARVNGAPIPEWRFRETARRLDQSYREVFGTNYEQIKPQLQIRRLALESLIEKELIKQDAHSIGLRASDSEIAEQIRTHPELQDPSGQFIGKERYLRYLDQSWPGGHAAFERQLAEELLESKWTGLVTQPVTVGDEELRQTFRRRTEKTSIDYVVVAAADQEIDRDVGDAELRRWYDEHIDDYRREAGRKIRYVVIDRDSQMESIEVPADEIRTYYDANQESYRHPEQRRARHILLRVDSPDDKEAVRARAEQLIERLRNGEDFVALAGELSEDVISGQRGGDLGFFGRGDMLEAFEQAAFDTPVGELAPLTETLHGFHVIEVTDSRPEGITPLEEVEEDIRRLLRFRSLDARVQDEANRLREAIGAADRFEEVAVAQGLEVQSVFFNAGQRIPDLGPSAVFNETVAQMEPGTLSRPLRVARGMALVVVDELLPPAPAPFEEVRSSISTALLSERTREAASAAARAALERHGDLAAVARALGKEVQESGDLAPGQAPSGAGGSSPELHEALFGDAVREGDRGVAVVPAGAIVYEISAREPFDPQGFEQEKATLREELLQDRRQRYRQSVLNRLRSRHQVEYNALWLDSLDDAG